VERLSLRIYGEPVKARDLQPGDLFTREISEPEAAEIELPDEFAAGNLHIRTEKPLADDDGEFIVWRITIQKEGL
jgi:hypothetical protein